MTYGEAIRLTRILRNDPSSALAAADEGWAYPLDRASIILADLVDRFSQANFKKPKPYPRPWLMFGRRKRGNTGGRSREQIAAILNAHGHQLDT